MSRRLDQLRRELRFALTRAATLRDARALIWQTCRFHLHNRLRSRTTGHANSEKTFEVRVRLDHDPVRLRLRPHAGDLFILYEVFLSRSYDIPESMLRPDEVRLIVDCGANVGLTSLFLANRYPRARVLAVEPHPDNFALLCRNTDHEPRIVPIHACVVGEYTGQRYISTDRPAWGNSINEEGRGVPVECVTLDELVQNYSEERIDLLKVDIEGAERELFAHASFLNRTRFAIIELHGSYGIQSLQEDVAPFHFDARGPEPEVNMVTVRPAQPLSQRP